MTLRLGWFTTARGSGSRAMYETVTAAIDDGDLDVEFAFVFCNREPGEEELSDGFFRLVDANRHQLLTRSSVRYRRAAGGERSRAGEPLPEWRIQYDRLVTRELAEHPFDLGVLAGYMLIFSGEFVQRHPLLNLHPALPGGPVGTWREVIRALIRDRASESGVMLHLAIAEVDAGSVAAYCRFPLRGSDLDPLWAESEGRGVALADHPDDEELEASALFAAIRERGVQYESPLLLATIAEFAAGRLRAVGGQVVGPDGAPRAPSDLTEQVRAQLATSDLTGASG